MNSKFHLIIKSREGLIFEGDVDSVSSYNEKGKFDVLPNHINFISLIEKGLTIREKEGSKEKNLDFISALMKVKENKVEVYLGVEPGKTNSARG